MAEALPDFSGKWLLERTDGEAEAFLLENGVPWAIRKMAKSMSYGAGKATQDICCRADGTFVCTARGGPKTTTMELKIGAGEQRTLAPDGSEILASIRWEGQALVVESRKLDGRVLPTMRRYMDGQGTHVLEALTSKGPFRRFFSLQAASSSGSGAEAAPGRALLSDYSHADPPAEAAPVEAEVPGHGLAVAGETAPTEGGEGQEVAAPAEMRLDRYASAVDVPWQHTDYSRADLLQWLTQEQDQVRRLFESPITPSTVIPKSTMPRPTASLTFKQVAFSVRRPDGSEQRILEEVSSHFEPGELVALMGPSGCGKSTLLDCLANKKTAHYDGEILVNGHPRDHLFQRIAAYVGQEDVMPQHWTVREAVEFNWKLKAPGLSNIPPEFEQRALDVMLAAFGLAGVAGTYIGGTKVRGCSGGQRRRVTLARGVAQRAAILFADEPTSGLSATDAELCVKALRIISKKVGCLILVVIHQPRVEVANLFDKLLLLTSNPGRMVYSGRMEDALAYWNDCGHPVPPHANPTDYYLDLITPGGHMDHANDFAEAFGSRLLPNISEEVERQREKRGLCVREMLRALHQLQSDAQMAPQALRERGVYAVPFTRQVAQLFRRKVKITRRNPSAIAMPVLTPVLLAVIMGLMFTGIGNKPLQSQVSFVFLLLMRICMGGMQNMPQLIDDRTVMKYETSENLYSPQAFIIVGFSVDIVLSLVGAVLNAIIMYVFSGLVWDYFPLLLGWALMCFWVFDSFFAMLAARAPNVQMAQVSAIPFQSIFMMFSGFVLTRNSAPSFLTWVFTISPLNYAIQSIFCRMAQDHGREGQVLLDTFGYKSGQEAQGCAIMIAMSVVFRVVQVVSLKYSNNIQK